MECVTEAEVLINLNFQSTQFAKFRTAAGLDNLIKVLMNICANLKVNLV